MSKHTKGCRTCRHLTAGGQLCGSPALKGELFCYYHHRDRQRQKLLKSERFSRAPRLTADLLDALNLPSPDDPDSIRVCIATLMRGILSGLINREQAGQVLYLIQLATVNNARETRSRGSHLVAITDPEPIQIPEDLAAEIPSSESSVPVEAVMVQRRAASADGVLVPNLVYSPANLDRVDRQWFTKPRPEGALTETSPRPDNE
jgi:hypothetical protein